MYTDYTENIKHLKDNLNRMMLYYFSKAFLDLPELSELKSSIEDPSKQNQIVLLTKDLSIKYDVTIEDYFNLLDKTTLLKSNTFYLIGYKEASNFNSFNFLINNYKEILENFIKILDVLNEINKSVNFKKSDILKNYLNLQQNLLNLHLQEINKTFFQPKLEWELPKAIIPIQEPKPRLKDLIIKGNAEAIEKVLINEFENTNNITINRMFTALSSLGYIIEEYGNKKKLIECINNSIGSEKYNSRLVFINKINVYNDKKYIQLRTKISNLLEKL